MEYFRRVIAWVAATFTNTRREMKGVDWGGLYGQYGDANLDPDELEDEVARLMMNDDVRRKKGIYPYVLTREERHLNIRAFTSAQKRSAYERQKGMCAVCGEHFTYEEMEADHVTPWHEGGKTVPRTARCCAGRTTAQGRHVVARASHSEAHAVIVFAPWLQHSSRCVSRPAREPSNMT